MSVDLNHVSAVEGGDVGGPTFKVPPDADLVGLGGMDHAKFGEFRDLLTLCKVGGVKKGVVDFDKGVLGVEIKG